MIPTASEPKTEAPRSIAPTTRPPLRFPRLRHSALGLGWWLSTAVWDASRHRLCFATGQSKTINIRWIDVITCFLGVIGICSAVASWIFGPYAKMGAMEDKLENRLVAIEETLARIDTRLLNETDNRQDRDTQLSARLSQVSGRVDTVMNRQHEGFQRLAGIEGALGVRPRGR